MSPDTLTGSCPHCSRPLTMAEVFDNCVRSWPHQSWLQFRCPDCAKCSHIHAVDCRIAIGSLDGFPGPCFIAHSHIGNFELRVSSAANGINLVVEDQSWFIPE